MMSHDIEDRGGQRITSPPAPKKYWDCWDDILSEEGEEDMSEEDMSEEDMSEEDMSEDRRGIIQRIRYSAGPQLDESFCGPSAIDESFCESANKFSRKCSF